VEGLLVAARDPDALAGALANLTRDPAARARMGTAARARSKDFDIAVATRRIEAIYREVLER
jgi:glycosyltransferase involved in cell wall biosynthesis